MWGGEVAIADCESRDNLLGEQNNATTHDDCWSNRDIISIDLNDIIINININIFLGRIMQQPHHDCWSNRDQISMVINNISSCLLVKYLSLPTISSFWRRQNDAATHDDCWLNFDLISIDVNHIKHLHHWLLCPPMIDVIINHLIILFSFSSSQFSSCACLVLSDYGGNWGGQQKLDAFTHTEATQTPLLS